jgi:4-amino-4-deoxy-L-arabinose transferase-like glycosyltransferase
MALIALAYMGSLGVLELRAEEPRRALIAAEMLLNRAFLVPHLLGEPYYFKPPAFFWTMASFFALFKSNAEWVVRLPSVLALFALAWITFRITKAQIGPRVGLYASLVLLTGADILFYGSINSGEIDLFFSLFICAGWYWLYHFYQLKKPVPLYLGLALFLSASFLIKGPPALLFYALSIPAWLFYKKDLKYLLNRWHFIGIAVIALIIGGYFWLYEQATGNAIAYLNQLFNEAGQKAGTERSMADRIGAFFSFPIQFAILSMPWSLSLLLLIDKELRALIWKNDFIRFIVIVFAINIVPYWISGRFVARYVYMFSPFVSILMVAAISSYQLLPKRKTLRPVFHVFMILTIGLVWAAHIFSHLDTFEPSIRISIVLSLSWALLYFFFLNKRYSEILLLAASMLLLRIQFNSTYLPLEDKRLTYKELASELYQKSEGQVIGFYGERVYHPVSWNGTTIATAAALPYQIPYYVLRLQHTPLIFQDTMDAGKAYVLKAELRPSEDHRTTFEFRDEWQGIDMQLQIYQPK